MFFGFLDDVPDDPEDAVENRWRRGARGAVQRVRRKSRVQKQHSYDDDIKPGAGQAGAQGVTASSTLTADGQGERRPSSLPQPPLVPRRVHRQPAHLSRSSPPLPTTHVTSLQKTMVRPRRVRAKGIDLFVPLLQPPCRRVREKGLLAVCTMVSF